MSSHEITNSFLLFFLIVFIPSGFGQFSETMVSDRPGQSNSPLTVGKRVIQIQTGVQFGGAESEDYQRSEFSFPAFLRFGVTEKIEVNALWSFKSLSGRISEGEFEASGLDMANFGLRINIIEEREIAPAVGVEFTYKTTMNSEDYRANHAATKFNIMASKGLSDLASITANLGIDFDGNGGSVTTFYTLNLALAVNPELSVFFENYGSFLAGDFDTFFDLGGGYMLNNNLQLDLYAGVGYNEDFFDYFAGGGISYRIPKWHL